MTKPLLGFVLALGALGYGLYATLSGHAPALSGSRRRRISLRGDTETTELKLFIDNDGALYRQQKQPIEKNLLLKIKKGVFDRTKAEKLWGYLVTNGAKKYSKEFSDGRDWNRVFSMADRKAVARALNDDFMAEHNVKA